MKLIDLSITLYNGLPCDPPMARAKIEYQDHRDTIPAMLMLTGAKSADELPDGLSFASENLIASSHAHTHMDAPWHYYPTTNDGERAFGIDEVPLEWCIGPGVVLDFSDKPNGYSITAADVEAQFKKMGIEMKPGTIVLVRSGAEWAEGTEDYFDSGAGMSAEATQWLCERGMKVCGTDAWGWDIPFKYCAENYAKNHDTAKIWEGHLAGKKYAYCHMEKLSNLKALPRHGFTVYAFPCKVKGASAGWVRCVASVEE